MKTKTVKLCSIENCDNRLKGRGYCEPHLVRLRAGKDLYNPPLRKLNKYRDGQPSPWRIDPNGYVVRVLPHSENLTGYRTQMEHRWVMEQSLGRPLLPSENVHHRNGDRADNRLSNLELWSTAQPAGQRIEDKIEYAIEILSTYAPERLK